MKKIKFRAWDVDSSEMFYSGYNNGVDYFFDFDDDTLCLYLPVEDNFPEKREAIIMQYTGLKDKNGKEIYEGDIVLFMGKNYRIKYFDKWGMFGLVGKSAYKTFNEDDPLGSGGSSTKYKPYCLGEYYQKRIEVVGNFYENPELC